MLSPVTSLTVTVYAPDERLEIVLVIAPVLHEYVYGATPPVTCTENQQ